MVVYWIKVNRLYDILITAEEAGIQDVFRIEQLAGRKFTLLFGEPVESTYLYKIETLCNVESIIAVRRDMDLLS